MIRSLSTFSMDDKPIQFEPDLSSMKELSDTEISTNQVCNDSDSNESMLTVTSTDSGASKIKRKKNNKLQTESKAILKKARDEKDKLRKCAARANETAEKRENPLLS